MQIARSLRVFLPPSGVVALAALMTAMVCAIVPTSAGPVGTTQPAATPRPRVIVSTDIGGSDPDDFQSMVHYLVYADRFDTEGLISSPPGKGRKKDILAVIDAYEKDYPRLRTFSNAYPTPDALRAVTKDGAASPSPAEGFSTPTDGSRLIVERAHMADDRPLWVLAWGSITDIAQAVHDDPSIKKKLRVYAIGAWNTAMDRAARNYLFKSHPDLWLIETDTTFRGIYVGGNQDADLSNRAFVEEHIRGHGALGDFFVSKKPEIKMGDSPSVLYLLHGDIDDPAGEHWGGSFARTDHGEHYWTDRREEELAEPKYYGAKTVSRLREAFLRDWQSRMERCK